MEAFAAGHGMNPLGAVMNRTGGIGGTEMSQNAHTVAGAAEHAAEMISEGEV
jgi:hypothetical protein